MSSEVSHAEVTDQVENAAASQDAPKPYDIAPEPPSAADLEAPPENVEAAADFNTIPYGSVIAGAEALHDNGGQPPASLGGFFWEILSFVGSGLEEGKDHPDQAITPPTVSEDVDLKAKEANTPHDKDAGNSTEIETHSKQHPKIFNRKMSFSALPDLSTVAAQTNSFMGMLGSFVGLSSAPPASDAPAHKREPSTQVFWEAEDDNKDEAADPVAIISSERPPVILSAGKELKNAPPILIDSTLAQLLRPHLPPLLREATTWRLSYSMSRHGISMQTLYRNCENEGGPALVVVKDTTGGIFGAFASEALHVRTGFYGNGSCFLWSKRSDNEVSVFKASGANDYLVLCEPHFMAFGGGEGRFGLWLSEDLDHGHSEPCQTFRNDRLSASADFHISSLEVFSFEM
ncbi:oxidation resistance protein 1 [Dinochytrium kinnereticum]|nr:oxidation resistance protein 1 [Dinochytrium kinnereticum]